MKFDNFMIHFDIFYICEKNACEMPRLIPYYLLLGEKYSKLEAILE